MTTYTEQQRSRTTAWKSFTGTLPPEAKHPAPYVDKIGASRGPAYDFCLPREHAALSLLPEVREPALALFSELGIPWHAGIDGGPSNHLLSSQVQCVNALGQMVHDPERLRFAFADVLGTQDVLEIEPGRFLTFEYIGPTDYFNEAPTGSRTRGAHCTSVDAAFLHRTSDGTSSTAMTTSTATCSSWTMASRSSSAASAIGSATRSRSACCTGRRSACSGSTRRSRRPPMTIDHERPGHCPRCGGPMLPIVYGYPGIEMREAEQRGEIVLGGCTVDSGMPAFSCRSCGKFE
jgi:hypothetical protein